MFTSTLDYASGPGSIGGIPQVTTLFARGTGKVNEDALLVAAGVYGVFDGATSLSGSTYGGLTGGYLASQLAAEVFGRNDRPLADLAALANEAIRLRMTSLGVDLSRKEELWSTSAAVVRYGRDMLEWCQTGDCRIQLMHDDGTNSQLVEPPDHDAETLNLWKQLGSDSRQPIQVALAGKILEVRRRMNIDYGVLNGEREALDFVRTGAISLAGVSAVLLYTDGLSVPDPKTGQSHDQDMLSRLFRLGGLQAVHNHIRSLQENDPQCLLYPRFKVSDDISAIALYQ